MKVWVLSTERAEDPDGEVVTTVRVFASNAGAKAAMNAVDGDDVICIGWEEVEVES
jgi:hypothetical protein